jgi:hypothetical protein
MHPIARPKLARLPGMERNGWDRYRDAAVGRADPQCMLTSDGEHSSGNDLSVLVLQRAGGAQEGIASILLACSMPS